MEQNNPPPQNQFLATALEQELLFLVGRTGAAAAQEIVGRFSAEQNAAVLNALDGCRAKHFITQDESGRLILTEDGRKQI